MKTSTSSINRRRFLKASTVVAAPMILPSGMWSASLQGAGPNAKLQLGLIGMGKRMQSLLRSFSRFEDVQIVAVNDVVDARIKDGSKRVAGEYEKQKRSSGSVTEFKDFQELLEQKSVDAVVISTPDHWHAIQSILAARAKKHIYCEKPLTRTIGEGRDVVKAARKNNVVYQTGSQQRTEYDGKFRTAVEYIRNGRIGDLKKIYIGVGGPAVADDLPKEDLPEGINWDAWLGPAPRRGFNEVLCPIGVHNHFPQWRRYKEYAGGGLSDIGAHHFDIAQWAMGNDDTGPVSITPPEDANATSGLVFKYANGLEMVHGGYEGRNGCHFFGTKGYIFVDRRKLESDSPKILETPLEKNDWRLEEIGSNHQRNWVDCIKSGKKPVADVEIGHRTNTICVLGNIGYSLNRPLKWDPKKERFDGDKEANALIHQKDRKPWGNLV